jgi:hypothetical protein
VKIQDLKIEAPIVIEDNEFVRVPCEKVRFLDWYPDCHVITISFGRENGQLSRTYTYLYRGNLPPLSKWYSVSSLPAIVRFTLYFDHHKDEVFTANELSRVFRDVSKLMIKTILSAYFNRKVILSAKSHFYGHERGLTKLEQYLTKNKIPFRSVKNGRKEIVITIKRGSKERRFTYSY